MLKFLFTHCQIFVMNFSYDSDWHYMSLNFSCHKIHGHKQGLIIKKLLVPIPILKRQEKAFKKCIYVLCIELAIIILIQ